MPDFMTPKKVIEYQDQTLAYEKFTPKGTSHIVCPNCRGLVMMFDKLSAAHKREIAQEDNYEMQLSKLITLTSCDQRQAKANIVHLIGASLNCRKCASDVPKGALLCSKCMSVNLHWRHAE